MKKNRFKSIVTTDRYGVTYVKNFTLWANGDVSLQRWDSVNHRVKNIPISRKGGGDMIIHRS